MCALPKSKVIAGQDSETKLLNIVQCCRETLVLRGKNKMPSKYCCSHSHFYEDATDIAPVYTPPELEYIKSKAADEVTLPDNDDKSLQHARRKQM